jgi:WD40 repeat protein
LGALRSTLREVSDALGRGFIALLERVGLVPRVPDDGLYHAFLSYNRAADGALAIAIQRGLQRFAKPWYRTRALRIFRDDASLSAHPSLWSSIVAGLDGSRYFILLASPESAASKWVAQEIDHWRAREERLPNLIVALTAGELVWDRDGADFDWGRTTALPASLQGVFVDEPRYIDLRWARTAESLSLSYPGFRDAIADLAAPLHGVPKDEIAGEEVRQHRRTIRVARAAAAGLLALTGAAIFFGLFALGQRDEATRQRNVAREQLRLAESRQLAAESESAPAVDRGLLLSLEALRISRTTEAQRAVDDAGKRAEGIVAVLRDTTDSVGGVLSPDWKLVAGSGDDSSLLVWEAATGRRIRTLNGHRDAVLKVAFSPDGRLLASASSDKTVIVWDVIRGQLTHTLASHTKPVTSVAFSPDGRLLASGSDDETMIVWDVSSGKPLRKFVQGDDYVLAVAFSPDGKLVASGSRAGSVTVWDLATGKARERLPGRSPVYSLAFSPDGTTLASGAANHVVTLWKVARGTRFRTLRGHTGIVFGVAFSPDGGTLASSGDEGSVILWDVRRGQRVRTLLGHGSPVGYVAFSRDGKRLASSSGSLILWDLAARPFPPPRTLLGHGGAVTSVAFSPDAKALATGSEEGTVLVWDAASGQRRKTLHGEAGTVYSVAFSPDGDALAAGNSGTDGAILWNLGDGSRRRLDARTGGHTGSLSSVAFSPDGKLLAGAYKNDLNAEGVAVWDVASGRRLRLLPASGGVSSVVFSPDGELLAASGGGVVLWSTESWHVVRTLQAATAVALGRVAFSGDGTMVAAGSPGGVLLWDVERGILLHTVGEPGSVFGLALGSRGNTLAVGGSIGRVTVWNVADGFLLRTLRGPVGNVQDLAFSPDEETIASANVDWTVSVFGEPRLMDDLDSTAKRFCSVARANLSSAEWKRLLPAEPYHRTCPEWDAEIGAG